MMVSGFWMHQNGLTQWESWMNYIEKQILLSREQRYIMIKGNAWFGFYFSLCRSKMPMAAFLQHLPDPQTLKGPVSHLVCIQIRLSFDRRFSLLYKFACCLRFNRWMGTWLDGDLTGQLNIQDWMMTTGSVCVNVGGGRHRAYFGRKAMRVEFNLKW